MSLPILKVTTTLTSAALARQFVQSEAILSGSIVEPLPIEPGAYCDPALSPLAIANRVVDAYLPDIATAEAMLRTVDEAFGNAGSECREWSINPTTPDEVRQKVEAALMGGGYEKQSVDLMRLQRSPTFEKEFENLQVVPGRTSPALVAELFAESSLLHANLLATAMARFVDETRLDSLLAIKNGRPIGFVGVLTLGQVGRVMHLFVAESHRRRGVGSQLVARALEVCARSLFQHVFVVDESAETRRMMERAGFKQATRVERFRSRGL